MIPRKTMSLIAYGLANIRFEKYYMELDDKLNCALEKAFTGERISPERATRIVKHFVENLRGQI